MNIYSLTKVKNMNVIPKYIYIQFKITFQDVIQTKKGAEIIWLNSDIKFVLRKNYVIVKEIGYLEFTLSQNLKIAFNFQFKPHTIFIF